MNDMKKSQTLQASIYEMGQLLNLQKDQVKSTLKSRKNIVIASILALIASLVVEHIIWGTLRYTGACINDIVQMGKYL
jgi:hypothetical protein